MDSYGDPTSDFVVVCARARVLSTNPDGTKFVALESKDYPHDFWDTSRVARVFPDQVRPWVDTPPIVLTDADAAADLAGTPRPDNPTVTTGATA